MKTAKGLIRIGALALMNLYLAQPVSGETVFGGAATRDVSNWITSSVAFDDAVQSGHSLNWENVVSNEVTVDSMANEFDLTWEAGANYTIGHLFMYGESFDLGSVVGGIQGLLWHANLETTAFPNWSPVIGVRSGEVTRYYRWNHSGNDWNGNGGLNFSNPMNAVDDRNEFDLSQLGNASNGSLGIWGELNATSGNFATTRDNPIGPNLQAGTGTVQFGFLQWASSGGQALESQEISTAIDCFEVIINPEPVTVSTLAIGAAENLTAVSATIASKMTTFGNAYSDVTLYWGTADGGTDFGAWENAIPLGVRYCEFGTELSGLTLDTTYFFRWYSENTAGGNWSNVPGSFTTLSTLPPAIVVSDGVSSSAGSATLNGEVTDTGNEAPAVTIFYGSTDEGTNSDGWDASVNLGAQGQSFSTTVEMLMSNTTYFYRAFAENSAGGTWSPSTASVTTLLVLDPEVVVSAGASASPGVATFLGEVTNTGNEEPEVTIFYGLRDGGIDVGAWDQSVFLGTVGGPFAEELSGLTGNTTYFYRAFVENSGGAGWAPESAMVDVLGFQGVSGILASDDFDFLYEMNVDPSSLNLDLGGNASDWFPNPAMATGVDQTMWIPQVYEGGIAKSNQNAGPPEALFRTDYTGSVSRTSLSGDFTLEVSVKLIEGSQANPDFDLGGFSIFVNPPGMDSLKLNINEDSITTGFGENETLVGSNTDGFHQFRVAYVESDEMYWVWKDGVLILGTSINPGGGFSGDQASVFMGGGLFLGDYSADISGDWEVDYIRLNNTAVSPPGGGLRVTGSGFVDDFTFFINFEGASNAEYLVKSSDNLAGFDESELFFLNGTSPVTDGNGRGRVEIDVTGRVPGRLYFRVERP